MEKKLKGFTIIELLVVITIITVLTAIGVPAALTWVRDARIRDANEEARLIYSAVQDYLTELEIKNISIENDENIRSVSDSGFSSTEVPAGAECVYGMLTPYSLDVHNFSDDLGETFEGAWYADINNETYTVEHVWWTPIPDGGSVTLTPPGGTGVPTTYADLAEQERDFLSTGVVIGQFPI